MMTMMIATTMSNITSEPLPPDSIRKHKPFNTDARIIEPKWGESWLSMSRLTEPADTPRTSGR